MPVSANPKATFPYVLKCDRTEPRSRQTRWKLRNLTRAEYDEYRKLSEQGALKGMGNAEARSALYAEVARIVAYAHGPDGEALCPKAEDLEQCLTIAEAWELYYAGLAMLDLEGDERKNSGSQSPSATDGPAATAQAQPPAKNGQQN